MSLIVYVNIGQAIFYLPAVWMGKIKGQRLTNILIWPFNKHAFSKGSLLDIHTIHEYQNDVLHESIY